MELTKPPSIEEFRNKRKAILNAHTPDKIKPSFLDKVAVWITNHVGSMGFFMIIFIWTVIWLGWNMFAPKSARFDPYPGFVLWLFISNMIQLFLMPLIMIGQNVQSRHADLRAEADLKINIQAELEIETILLHLEYQNNLMLKILKDIEKKP
ncbi:MAG: rane protein-like protein [Mucilaginibacter sp.]|nr:rane protein-like protein [Mucilaginibacter sp.]